MKNIIGILVLVGIVWWASGLFSKEEWTPFFYPDLKNLEVFETGPIVESLDKCRDWIDANAYAVPWEQSYDYECGLNCEYRYEFGLNVCEETIQ